MVKFLRCLLFPFSALFYCIVKLRRMWYAQSGRRWKSPVPAIVVGNLTTGGTGKTPHTALIAEILLQHGKKAAWLSRGYGRKTNGFLEVRYDAPASQTGDEPLMVKHKYPEMPVFVCENRPAGIQQLLKTNPETRYVVLDDAFQHLKLKPHVAIVLLTWESLHKPWMLLPAGNAREPLSALRHARMVLITKCPDGLTDSDKAAMRAKIRRYTEASVYFSVYRYLPLTTGKGTEYIPRFEQDKAVLLAAIADQTPLYNWLVPRFHRVAREPFSDHHAYTRSELEHIVNRFSDWYWIVTEKDVVRIREVWPEWLESSQLLIVGIQPELGSDKMKFENELLSMLKD